MTDMIPFWKYTAAGNDFICIDNWDGRWDSLLDSPSIAEVARRLCDRHKGIGADGVLFSNRPPLVDHADVYARLFEADGSECELCGNGTACFVHWCIETERFAAEAIRILTPAGVVLGEVKPDGYTRVCVPAVQNVTHDLAVEAGGQTFVGDFCITGIPHYVVNVPDVAAVDVNRYGRLLRHHEAFAPRGVCVNFVEQVAEREIRLRTFEFGVEAETFACGTGSTSAAILSALRHGWVEACVGGELPVLVHAIGGTLRIFFERDENGVFDPCLETRARPCFTGTIAATWF